MFQFFGSISQPPAIAAYGGGCGGIITLVTNLLRLAVVVAGIVAVISLILAGYQYMTSGGDMKAVDAATKKITTTFIGLLVIAGSFLLAALFGVIIFGNAGAILNPVIYGPGSC